MIVGSVGWIIVSEIITQFAMGNFLAPMIWTGFGIAVVGLVGGLATYEAIQKEKS